MNQEWIDLVLAIVLEVPSGKVASYSQIAKLAGYPRYARQVGWVLKRAEHFGDFPCHRIVHANGSLVNGWMDQKRLLKNEGVVFKTENQVDMKKCQWKEKKE